MNITREKWSKVLNVELPKCAQCGLCCRCATPSKPKQVLLDTKPDDKFTIDFFAIFEPYDSIDEAMAISPEIVKRSLEITKDKDSLVFYKCKHLSDDNKCLIYEQRPELCRSHPDNPYLVFPKECSFKPWAQECKEKHNKIKEELEVLRKYKKQIEDIKNTQ